MKELHWNRYNAAADLDPFPDIRYQCPVCYKSFKEEYDECPNCGLVVKRTCDNCNKVRCFIGSPGSGGCHWEKKEEFDNGLFRFSRYGIYSFMEHPRE